MAPGPAQPPVASVCLVVLDGFGLAEPGPGNAVELADTPVFDELWETYPHSTMTAWGPAVGLPEGQMGNSEVGHLNLGAGAVVKQDITRIDDDVAEGGFDRNDVLREACRAAGPDGRLHLLGLVSAGGVHASMDHLRALVELAGREGVGDVVLHAFTDGRDTSPDSGAGYLAEVEGWGGVRVATVTGRYFAMDRDRRWDRIKLAWDAIVHGQAETPPADSGEAAVRAAYERGETDEFIKPTLVGERGADSRRRQRGVLQLPSRPRPGDDARAGGGGLLGVRPRRTARGWRWPRSRATRRTGTTRWPTRRPAPRVTLASVLAERGFDQLHVAETEKYAHVTYFFNGGEEHPYGGEERRLVDSPRDVATYDQKPEMSAEAAADAFVESWESGRLPLRRHQLRQSRHGGPHRGDPGGGERPIETVDRCLARVVEAVHASGGACIVTADHGNADQMLNEDGSTNTQHSMNPVPVVITSSGGVRARRRCPARRGAHGAEAARGGAAARDDR